jgi:hypothetical protein
MQASVALVVLKPFIEALLMELMTAFSLDDFTLVRTVLNTMWTDSLQLFFTN